MKTWLVGSAISLVVIAAAAAPAGGQPGSSHVPYVLESQSKLEWGCIGPCMCPVGGGGPLSGTFRLRRLDPDPLFEHYEVTDIDWIDQDPAGAVRIRGKGTYVMGGEVAARQRMILDLELNGGPPQRFDSGFVDGGGEFPKLDIAVRSRPETNCRDTLITLHAMPATLGIRSPLAEGSLRAGPNPFDSETRIGFLLHAPARTELTIYDLAGRPVRRLTRAFLDAGPHSVAWDGRADDGAEAGAGFFLARVRAGGGESARVLIKLR